MPGVYIRKQLQIKKHLPINQIANKRANIKKSLASKKESTKKLRYGIFAGNFLVFILLFAILMTTPKTSSASKSSINNVAIAQASINPLDQVSSSQIAETISTVTSLPESVAVKNQNETVNAKLSQTAAVNNVAAKAQVVATHFVSKNDIKEYVVQSGDTLASIAAKFNVTSNSVLWSNSIPGGKVIVGQKLLIPPVSGIVYTVKAGDTIASLASKYSSNSQQLTAYNDAEIAGIKPGDKILIPNGQQPAAPVYNFFAATYGFNGYDYGYCTWYVATQINVPGNWGNASSWAYYASLSGWNVSSTPSIGSVAQTGYGAGGEGHVAVVVGVSPDGSQIQIKDMNNYADGGGWGRVGGGWFSASTYQHYIIK